MKYRRSNLPHRIVALAIFLVLLPILLLPVGVYADNNINIGVNNVSSGASQTIDQRSNTSDSSIDNSVMASPASTADSAVANILVMPTPASQPESNTLAAVCTTLTAIIVLIVAFLKLKRTQKKSEERR